MIPKIVHYCWFGQAQKNYLAKACLQSFVNISKRGEIKIIEWNESNCSMDETQYVKEAFAKRSWAHVSDYYRLKALYDYGGIYLDTDVEIRKPFPEEWFQEDLVLGFMYECAISTAVIMAKPKHPYIAGLLKLYEKTSFDVMKPNNAIFNDYTFANYPNFRLNGKEREFAPHCIIYPRYYFEVPTFGKEGGYSVHHFMGSWHHKKKSWKSVVKPVFKWLRFHCRLLDWWYQNKFRNRLLISSGYYARYKQDLNRQ